MRGFALRGSIISSIYQNSIKIEQSYFLNSKAHDEGGFIYLNESNHLEIINSTFENGIAWKGGAIFANLTSFIQIQSSIFLNNTAISTLDLLGGLGGAICLNKTNKITVNYSNFTLNKVHYDGGAVFSNFSNNVSLLDTSFMLNTAFPPDILPNNILPSMLPNSRGGGIASLFGSVLIKNCDFKGNKVEDWGGAIFIHTGNLNLMNGYFERNGAGFGSAMFLNQEGIFNISNITVINSLTTRYEGGVIYAYQKSIIKIINSEFTQNDVTSVFFLIKNNVLELENISLSYLTSWVNNPGIYLQANNNVTLINITAFSIKSPNSVGFAYLGSYFNIVNIFNSTFSYISATMIGGCFYLETSNMLTISNTSFIDISAGSGGVIYGSIDNTIYLKNCIFKNLVASSQSGLIGFWKTNRLFIIKSLVFNSSSAVSGAGYFIDHNNITIEDSYFNNLGSKGFGGAFGISNNNQLIILRSFFDTIVTKNQDGGVILSENAGNVIYFQNCSFVNSKAGRNGGAITLSNGASGDIINCIFINNIADGEAGGAISIIYLNSATIKDSIFVRSLVVSGIGGGGGAIYIANQNQIHLSNNTFVNISIPFEGGVIMILNLNNVTDENSTYTSIFCPEKGGVFYLANQNIFNIMNDFIFNISGPKSGGVFYIEKNNTLNIFKMKTESVEAYISGGFIYMEDENQVFITFLICKNVTVRGFGGFLYALFNNLIEIIYSSITQGYNKGLSGGLSYLKDSNALHIIDSNIQKITCLAYKKTTDVDNGKELRNQGGGGGIVFAEMDNIINSFNSHFSFIETQDSGAWGYLTWRNRVIIQSCLLMNVKTYGRGGLIYATTSNTILMNDTRIMNMEGREIGCVLYLGSGNLASFTNNSIQGAKCQSYNYSNSFIYFIDNNLINFFNSEIQAEAYCNQTVLFYGKHYNKLNINKSDIRISKMESFIFLDFSNYLNLFNASFITASLFNIFIILQNGTFLNASHLALRFSSSQNYFSLIAGEAYFKNIITSPSSLFFNILDSAVNLKKIQFKSSFSFIFAINSNISITRSLFISLGQNNSIKYKKNQESAIKLINSKLNIKKCIFLHCESQANGGGITLNQLYFSNKKLDSLIYRNSFILNKAKGKGGALYLSKINENVLWSIQILFNIFKLNQALEGGSVYTQNMKTRTNFTQNRFIQNLVKIYNTSDDLDSNAKGGAIYLNVLTEDSFISILANTFVNNSADVGGAIFSSKVLNVLMMNYFETNRGKSYGSNVASNASSLSFSSNFYSDDFGIVDTIKLNAIVSGYYSSECLVVISGVDEYLNEADNSDENLKQFIAFSQITPPPESGYSNSIEFDTINGKICIRKFKREQLPIQMEFSYLISYKKNYFLSLNIEIRNCISGERLTDSFECILCDESTYSLQTNFSQTSTCIPCLSSAPFICLGGNVLSPKTNYWRANPSSLNFIKCSVDEICLPFNKTTQSDLNLTYLYTGTCIKGYKGPFCNVCDDGYGKIGSSQCISCQSGSWIYYLMIVVQVLLKIFYAFYCVFIAFKMISSIIMRQAQSFSIIALNLLKILVIHVQLISFILKMPFDWSINLKVYLPIIFSFSPDISEAFNLQCFMKDLEWTLPEQYFIIILIPIYIALLYIFSLLLVSFKKKLVNDRDFRAISQIRLGSSVFFIIIILTYIDLSKVNLEMFQCMNIDDADSPDYRLVNDVEINCDSVYHNLWKYLLTLPMLIFCVAIILFIFIRMALLAYRNGLESNECKMEFGYFYYAYKRKFFYWDLIILIRRLLILFFFLFFYQDLMSKNIMPIVLIVFVLLVALSLQIYIHPFDKEFSMINKIEKYSLISLSFSYILVLIYGTFYFGQYDVGVSWLILLIFFICLINIAFFLIWIHCYFKYYLKKGMQTVIFYIKKMKGGEGKLVEKLIEDQSVIDQINDYLSRKSYLIVQRVTNNLILSKYITDSKLFCSLSSTIYHKFEEKQILSQFRPRNISRPLLDYDAIIKIENENLKNAFLNKEVLIYEEKGMIKIYYSKKLKGNNHFDYVLISQIKVLATKKIKLFEYEFEDLQGLLLYF